MSGKAPELPLTPAEPVEATEEPQVPAVRSQGVLAPVKGGPMDILRVAVEKGIDTTAIKDLAELAWKEQNRQAHRDFNEAMRLFRERCPAIPKDKSTQIATSSGGSYPLKWASLEGMSRIVDPILSDLGLSYTWDGEVKENLLVVRCTLSHVNGHEKTSTFTCPTAARTPGMSEQQKFASADSFGRRYTLTAVLGLTSSSEEPPDADPTPIGPEEVERLEHLIADVGADRARFLSFMKVEYLEDIPRVEYERAVKALEAKRGRG